MENNNIAFGRQLLYFFLMTLGAFLGAQFIGSAFLHLYTSSNQLIWMQIAQIINSLGCFLVPALWFGHFATHSWLSYNQADNLPPKKMVWLVLLLSFLLLPVISVIAYWNEHIQLPASLSSLEEILKMMENQSNSLIEKMMGNMSWNHLPFLLLLFALIPAICEEFFFRGTLQKIFFNQNKRSGLSILLTAFIFSFIHLQFYGFVPRFLLGIYLGYLFLWSGSLWLPIFAHFLHNSFSVILFLFFKNYYSEGGESINPTDIPHFYWFCLFSIVFIVCGLWRIYRMYRNKKQIET
jgi:membrane protease YdiL (CAAX protease family)